MLMILVISCFTDFFSYNEQILKNRFELDVKYELHWTK